MNVTQQNRWGGCLIAYSTYVKDAYSDILSRVMDGGDPEPLMPPENYAVSYGGPCVGLDDHYPISADLKPRRDRSVSNALAFVLLHELGHHYYGHISEPLRYLDLSVPANMRLYLQAMCFSHQKERQADEFAARTLVDLGWLGAALDQTMWMTTAAIGSIDPDLERGATHPSSSRRWAHVLDTVRKRMGAKGIAMPANLSTLVDEAIRVQRKIDDELPLNPIPGSEGIVCN